MHQGQVKLLWGDEGYLIEKRIREIIEEQACSGEEPECVFLDGEELDRTQLLAALQFVPLFASRRVVVVRRPNWFGSPGAKAARGLAEVQEVLLSYLENPSRLQVVLMTAPTVAQANPLVKVLKKKGMVEEVKRLDSRQLAAWVSDEFGKRGARAESTVIRWLVSTGKDMFFLENQIEKLSLGCKHHKVTMADLQSMVEVREDVRVFKLTDALLRRDISSAHQALDQLFVQGDAPVLIVYLITRQFVLMAKVKSLAESGHSPGEMAGALGQREFVVAKMGRAAALFGWGEIESIFRHLLQADTALKSTGQDERLLLELLVTAICVKQPGYPA